MACRWDFWIRTYLCANCGQPSAGRFADVTPMEEKESYHWLEALKNTDAIMGDTQVVTVCDREADMYGLFELGDRLKSPVLVRANVDRAINRKSRYAEEDVVRLWSFMRDRPAAEPKPLRSLSERPRPTPKRETHGRPSSPLSSDFRVHPPRNKHPVSPLTAAEPSDVCRLRLRSQSSGERRGRRVDVAHQSAYHNFQEACEKVHWYCLRWRIEMYFKVLKIRIQVEGLPTRHR